MTFYYSTKEANMCIHMQVVWWLKDKVVLTGLELFFIKYTEVISLGQGGVKMLEI